LAAFLINCYETVMVLLTFTKVLPSHTITCKLGITKLLTIN